MSSDEKTAWNAKYAAGSHAALEPEPFLVNAFQEFLAARPPGVALDVAGGAGRHALWLARRGWRVKLVDISEVGVNLARARAAGISPGALETEVVDLSSAPALGDEIYDLVMVFSYLERSLFPALIRALKPDALLVYQAPTVEALRRGTGPSNPNYLLRPGELSRAFRSLLVLHYREHGGRKGMAELVARKAGGQGGGC